MISPFGFLIAPPYPVGPMLTLSTPSTLSLKVPAGGACQQFGLETCTGGVLAIELFGGNSLIPRSYSMILSFASTEYSSCVHICREMVSFRWAYMEFHTSSYFLALFSKVCLFWVFNISHIVKPGKSSQRQFKILFLKLLIGQSTIVMSGFPLCLWFFLNIDAPFSHKESATLHSSSRWFMVSLFSSHMQHLDIP